MRRHSFLALLVTLFAVVLPCFGQMNQPSQNYQRRIYSISGKVNDDADERGIDNVRVNLSRRERSSWERRDDAMVRRRNLDYSCER